MNEQLLDICIKAGINTWPFNEVGFISLDESELVKFAELIVQECLEQVAMIGISNFENDDFGDISWTVGKCIEMIKKHFGVN